MFKNYIKIAFRNLWRNKAYTFINVMGLAMGMAVVLLIVLYIQHELGYDRFHEAADDMYRIQLSEETEVSPSIIAPLLQREVPEVVAATRLYDISKFHTPIIQVGNERFEETRFMYADSTVFSLFNFPLLSGDSRTALIRPQTLVLTASTAQRYFGRLDVVGEVLQINGGVLYEVTGVMADVPTQSHVQFNVLASFASTNWADREIWSSANFLTYVQVQTGAPSAVVQSKLNALIETARTQDAVTDSYSLMMVPLTDIWLYLQGRVQYLYLFGAIALLMLLVACINYINLATARAARRGREVGIRKIVGARRKQLITQFLGESLVTTLLALAIGLFLAEVLLPVFNTLSEKPLDIAYANNAVLGLTMLGIAVVIGIAGGGYPAFLLASFQPATILKQSSRSGTGGTQLRRVLVVFQFAVAIVLMVGTFVVYQQLGYIQNKNLGFDKEQVMVLPIGDSASKAAYPALRDALLQHPRVLQASAINSIPGYQRGGYALRAEGLELPPNEFFPIGGVPTDPYVMETLGLNLVAGSNFTQSPGYDPRTSGYEYLVNEATVRALGWNPEAVIGKRMSLSANREGTLVGVIEDFHARSLHETIAPLAFFIEPSGVNYLMVKMAPGSVAEPLNFIEQTWQQRLAHRPFSFTFLDQRLEALYQSEQRAGQLVGLFAGLAIFIACLGLFGLAAFTAGRRTKEIGIRKVLGASVPQIVLLLTKEFLLLVGIAFLIASPIAYAAMQRWLEAFAYQVDVGVTVFIGAGLLALIIAWLTVSYQSIRAAFSNPVEALRYE